MSVFGKLANAAIGVVQDKKAEIDAKNNELRAYYLERLMEEESKLSLIYRVRFKESMLTITRSKVTVLDEMGAVVVEGKYGGLDDNLNRYSADIKTTEGDEFGRLEAKWTKGEDAHRYYRLHIGEEREQRFEEYSEDITSFKDLKHAANYTKYKLVPKGWMLVSDNKEGMLLRKDEDVPVCIRRVFDGDKLVMRIDVPKMGSKTADGFRFIIRCANKSVLLYGVLLSIALSHAIDRPS